MQSGAGVKLLKSRFENHIENSTAQALKSMFPTTLKKLLGSGASDKTIWWVGDALALTLNAYNLRNSSLKRANQKIFLKYPPL